VVLFFLWDFRLGFSMQAAKDALAPTRARQKTTSGSLNTRWNQAEDQQLLQLLRSGERANWTELAPHFPGKTAQQIAERWGKVVDPVLVKGSWTRQEDEMIIEFVEQFGTKNWTNSRIFCRGGSANSAASDGGIIWIRATTASPGRSTRMCCLFSCTSSMEISGSKLRD
jgi:hypothetical protein